MKLATVLLFSAALASTIACQTKDDASTASGDLIGGTTADDGQLPSTMQVLGNCTVAKVGPSLVLTAAHCVLDSYANDLRADFKPGATLNLVTRGRGGGYRQYPIEKTVVHPRAMNLCKNAHICLHFIDVAAFNDVPDVAIIVVKGEIEGVPTATIDVDPATVGDDVTMTGYGCTTGVRSGGVDGKLRSADVKLIETSSIQHLGGLVTTTDSEHLAQVQGNYLITPGPKRDAAAGGLCPGDSGGPLYRKGTSTIVGVNASYSFEYGGEIPVTNWHTRLDAKTPHGVGAWLESLGVSLTRSCAEAGCTAATKVEEDPCRGFDYRGKCTGSVIEWCDKGTYKLVDCTSKTDGRTACGPDPKHPEYGNNCVEPPRDPCETLDYKGKCTGTVIEWCDRGVYKKVDCTSKTDGRVACGLDYDNPTNGNNCIRPR